MRTDCDGDGGSAAAKPARSGLGIIGLCGRTGACQNSGRCNSAYLAIAIAQHTGADIANCRRRFTGCHIDRIRIADSRANNRCDSDRNFCPATAGYWDYWDYRRLADA